jgi:hypothetical protein
MRKLNSLIKSSQPSKETHHLALNFAAQQLMSLLK